MADVLVMRLDPELALPALARAGDAGFDLLARHDTVIEPGGRSLVPTAVALALPSGYAGFVLPRSGLALRHGVTVLNSPGLVDSGYRGEVAVVLVNTDLHQAYEIRRGDRIAQLVIQAVEKIDLVEVDELPGSPRGTAGFGHSGR